MDELNQTPAEGVLQPGEPTPAAPVTVEVPAEHADLLQRAVALLQRGEQTIKDNIEAGIATLEKWYADVTKSE